MANAYHHSVSSANKWGGTWQEFVAIHSWFDSSKNSFGDFRHRALRHHAEGIHQCEIAFGPVLRLSNGKIIPVRWVAEQHVREDLGRIPTLADWLRCIKPEPWMGRTEKLPEEKEPHDRTGT